jgi:hypothetical protein
LQYISTALTKNLEFNSQESEAHTCNPSYSGGRDQEDPSSKPAQAKKFMKSYLEKPFTKIGLKERLKVKTLSSRPSTTKKRKKEKKMEEEEEDGGRKKKRGEGGGGEGLGGGGGGGGEEEERSSSSRSSSSSS